METGARWHLVDTLRGWALINMVLYHLLFDVYVLWGFDPLWPGRWPVHV